MMYSTFFLTSYYEKYAYPLNEEMRAFDDDKRRRKQHVCSGKLATVEIFFR